MNINHNLDAFGWCCLVVSKIGEPNDGKNHLFKNVTGKQKSESTLVKKDIHFSSMIYQYRIILMQIMFWWKKCGFIANVKCHIRWTENIIS